MNRLYTKSFFIGFLIGVVIALILIATGCSTHTYSLSVCSGPVCSKMQIKSRLELDEVEVDYLRDDMNKIIGFHFEARKATSTPIDTETVKAIVDGVTKVVPR